MLVFKGIEINVDSRWMKTLYAYNILFVSSISIVFRYHSSKYLTKNLNDLKLNQNKYWNWKHRFCARNSVIIFIYILIFLFQIFFSIWIYSTQFAGRVKSYKSNNGLNLLFYLFSFCLNVKFIFIDPLPILVFVISFIIYQLICCIGNENWMIEHTKQY